MKTRFIKCKRLGDAGYIRINPAHIIFYSLQDLEPHGESTYILTTAVAPRVAEIGAAAESLGFGVDHTIEEIDAMIDRVNW